MADSWSKSACDLWIERFGGTCPGGQIGRWIKPLVVKHGWEAVARGWRAYLAQATAQYASPKRFADTYGEWAGRTRAQLPDLDWDQSEVYLRRRAHDATPREKDEPLESWIDRIDRKVEEMRDEHDAQDNPSARDDRQA